MEIHQLWQVEHINLNNRSLRPWLAEMHLSMHKTLKMVEHGGWATTTKDHIGFQSCQNQTLRQSWAQDQQHWTFED